VCVSRPINLHISTDGRRICGYLRASGSDPVHLVRNLKLKLTYALSIVNPIYDLHKYCYSLPLYIPLPFNLTLCRRMSPPSAIDVQAITDTESILLPSSLTSQGIAARRAKAGKLVAGTAAFTSSDNFKGPVSDYTPPVPHVLIFVGYRQA
jgi:hypothetical protein